jgi:hypothetical protein
MTNKDYRFLAKTLYKHLKGQKGLLLLVQDIADYLQTDNPNFDHVKFVRVCVLGEVCPRPKKGETYV